MSSNTEEPDQTAPDYDLEELRMVSSTPELKALFHPLREQLVDLLLERAATISELAQAVSRPAGTVAYHVDKLVAADLLKVVRTRRVRAIDERFYGRTAKMFYVGQISSEQLALMPKYLPTAVTESAAAHRNDELRAFLRYANISEDAVAPFWRRVMELVKEFSALPRTGSRSYGLLTALYPTERPILPPSTDSDEPDNHEPGEPLI